MFHCRRKFNFTHSYPLIIYMYSQPASIHLPPPPPYPIMYIIFISIRSMKFPFSSFFSTFFFYYFIIVLILLGSLYINFLMIICQLMLDCTVSARAMWLYHIYPHLPTLLCSGSLFFLLHFFGLLIITVWNRYG